MNVKKIVAAALSLIMVLVTLPTAASAEPTLGAQFNGNSVSGFNFQPEAPIHITVNDPATATFDTTSDQFGNFRVDWWNEGNESRLLAGDTVAASDGVNEVSLVVEDIVATVDVAGNSVLGTARAPGGAPLSERFVRANVNSPDWQTYLASATAETDLQGQFVIYLSPFVLEPWQHVQLSLWSAANGTESGNFTLIEVYNGVPSLGSSAQWNWIQGNNFPPLTAITVNVKDKGTTKITTDSGGNFWVQWWDVVGGQDELLLLPGDTITATFAGGIAEMVIQDGSAVAHLDTNTVTGTALTSEGSPLAGRRVRVGIYDSGNGNWTELASGETTTNGNGDFTVNSWSPSHDLVRGEAIQVQLWNDPDGAMTGHSTFFEAYNAIPAIGAMARQNWIQGNSFPPWTAITVNVKDKGTTEITTDPGGNFWVQWWDVVGGQDELLLLPGDTITATFAGGIAEMVIQDGSAVAHVDTNTVTGLALTPGVGPLAGRKIRVGIYDTGDGGSNWTELASAEATTFGNGSFTVNSWSPDHVLVRGETIQIQLWDAPDGTMSGHSTFFEAYNGIPAFGVSVGENRIIGWGFPPNASITVSVNAGPVAKGSETVETDGQGSLWLNWWPHGNENRLLPGDTITADCDGEITEMVVPDLQAAADVAENTITGTAFDGSTPLAGRKVEVSINPGDDWGTDLAIAETTVDDSGNFALDLDLLPSPFDLVRGQHIWLTLWDAEDGSESGNETSLEVYNGIPVLGAAVDHNWIRGNNFPPDTDVTISVNGGANGSATVKTDSRGNFFSSGNDEWEQDDGEGPSQGDTITASYGTTVVQMVVQHLEAVLDIENNTVSGTAFDGDTGLIPLTGEKVEVNITRSWEQQEPHAWLDAEVGADGQFLLDFNGSWDINRGDAVFLTYTSPEGHQTMRQPAPVDITGTVRKDNGAGPGMSGVLVHLYSSLMNEEEQTSTNGQGVYTFRGLDPGVYKLFFEAAGHNQANGTNYQSVWNDNQPTFETAEWIVVSPMGGIQEFNAVLEDTGGGIAGTVTGDGVLALKGIYVCAQPVSWTELEPNCVGLTGTGADGTFSISGLLPDDYRVLFYAGDYNENNGTSYANLWYGSVVTVATGDVEQIPEVQLSTGGAISGRVTAGNDLPLPNISVNFIGESGLWAGGTETNDNGEYLQGLPAGNYTVTFDPKASNEEHDLDFLMQWYREPGETVAALVGVVSGETTEDIGARLELGGRIVGRVFGSDWASLPGIWVQIRAAGNGSETIGETLTNDSGQYVIRGLVPGSYKTFFDPVFYNQAADDDYLPEWYHNKPYFAAATSVAVPVGKEDAPEVNARLIHPDDGSLFVTMPTVGATWAQGTLQTIRWEGRVATGDVKILLYNTAGTPKASIVSSSTPNIGRFDWMVPGTLAPGSYRLQVVWLSNPAITANSATFTVTETTGLITVAPLLASVAQGEEQTINWSGIPLTGNVKILLYLGTKPVKAPVTASAPNVGSFKWVVPGTLAAGTYKLKVVWLSKPTLPDNGATFVVTETTGTIVATPLLASVAQGEKQTISWSGIPLTGNVKILLYLGTKAVKAPVTASAPNVGSFEWVVPGTLVAGTYKLKVVWLSKPTLPDNGATFDVAETTGTIVATPLLASVAQGEKQTISWSGIPLTGNVKILLYLGTKAVKAPVTASAPNVGSFEWVVPGTLAAGTYKLKVVWLSKPTLPDNGAT
ncbi:MAG: carboxypeptidase regulatory-like domain-containing protein, partial [Candidatus Geothermincolia bacterium]